MTSTNFEQIRNDVRTARAALHDDLAELDHHIHRDIPTEISARVSANAPAIVAAAGVLGAVIALGGRRALKALLVIGVPAAIGAVYVRKRMRG